MNPPTVVEHRVELDTMQYTTPQLGEEQVFDVELDRRTELLPVREDVREVSWEDVLSAQPAPEEHKAEKQEAEQEEEPGTRIRLVECGSNEC